MKLFQCVTSPSAQTSRFRINLPELPNMSDSTYSRFRTSAHQLLVLSAVRISYFRAPRVEFTGEAWCPSSGCNCKRHRLGRSTMIHRFRGTLGHNAHWRNPHRIEVVNAYYIDSGERQELAQIKTRFDSVRKSERFEVPH
jgi:hypothetical protein